MSSAHCRDVSGSRNVTESLIPSHENRQTFWSGVFHGPEMAQNYSYAYFSSHKLAIAANATSGPIINAILN